MSCRYNPDRWLEPNAEFIKVEAAGSGNGAELPAVHATSAENVELSELREQGYAKRFIPFSYGRWVESRSIIYTAMNVDSNGMESFVAPD